MAKTEVNSATLIMGVTGSGKSDLLATLARYVWKKYHKVTLLYTCDGGGFPAEVQACLAAGIMWVFRLRTRDPGDLGLSVETCYRAAQGWWPKRITASTGEVEPGVEMVPPVAKRWVIRCPQGHEVKAVVSQSLIQPMPCPVCKRVILKPEMTVQEVMNKTAGFESVGAVCYDGLSSMLSWQMQEMAQRAGRLELKGEEGALGGKIISGDLRFGSSNRAHYGFVQTRGEELVHLTLGIPNLVVPPVWTALTMEDTDERALSIIGPKLAGRAKTDEAPQWFGNCLETAKIPAELGSGEQFVLNLSEYTDVAGRRHLCKHRGSGGTMPERLIDPKDAPHAQVSLGVFFELLEQALDRRIEEVKKEFPDAPGVPEGVVEFGVPTAQPAPAPTAPPVLAAATPAPRPVARPVAAPPPGRRPVAPPVATAGQPVRPRPPAPAVRVPTGEHVTLTTADIVTVNVADLVSPSPTTPEGV